MKNLSKLNRTLKPYYLKLFIATIAVLAVILIFGRKLNIIFFVTSLLIIATVSTFYHNFFKSPINFELIKFSTILTAASYGAVIGLATGIISTLASKILSEKLDHTAMPSLLGIAVIAVLADLFSNWNITALGITMVIAYHAITAPIQLATGGTLLYGAIYVGSNVLFNILLFTRFAPAIIKLM
ncbi:hypothetical protein HY640_02855 [Candidatus Woesearchaeota archaeon]|nr:hypothetical protein [Candidatus Woesearchaeota archaeon]